MSWAAGGSRRDTGTWGLSMQHDGSEQTPRPSEAIATRRRFIRQAAGVGVGGAALLLIPRIATAEDKKDDKKKDEKPTPTPTPAAAATPRPAATPTATPTPTPTPTQRVPQVRGDDETPEPDGEEIVGSPRGGDRGRRRLHTPPRPPRRRKYLRIDHANAGIGQTILVSPDPDAAFVVQNAMGAGVVGESTGALGGFNSVGVKGLSTSGIGVDGESVTDTGVFGGSQNHYGVHGKSDQSVGVLGETSGISWASIGRAHGPAFGGVSGTTANRGKGVEGLAGFGEPIPGPPPPPPDPSTFPVIGVFGAAKSPEGVATGILGVTHDASGRGVSGEGPFGGVGVHGFSTTGVAVRGVSQHGFGMEAFSDHTVGLVAATGGADWGIIGRCAPSGVGGISGFAPSSVGVEGVTDGLGGAGIGVQAINNFRDPSSDTLAARALEVIRRPWFISARRWGSGPGTTVITATGVDGAGPVRSCSPPCRPAMPGPSLTTPW